MDEAAAEDARWMELALEEAEAALAGGEVPVGCVFVQDGQPVARGANRTNASKDATRHAELVAIEDAIEGGMDCGVLAGSTLYVTVEPCIMCAAAVHLMQVGRIVFGASNQHFGGCGTVMNVQQASRMGGAAELVPGLLADRAVNLLQRFYANSNPSAPEQKPRKKRRREALRTKVEGPAAAEGEQ